MRRGYPWGVSIAATIASCAIIAAPAAARSSVGPFNCRAYSVKLHRVYSELGKQPHTADTFAYGEGDAIYHVGQSVPVAGSTTSLGSCARFRYGKFVALLRGFLRQGRNAFPPESPTAAGFTAGVMKCYQWAGERGNDPRRIPLPPL